MNSLVKKAILFYYIYYGKVCISIRKQGVYMKIYIVRHGETECNVNNICYGWYDCPINEKGISQAKNLGKFLKTKKIDKIISSDLLRARMTAELINNELNLPIEF
ncbi:MAG: histidine phosphatase family protein, partial [Lachnospiraceae bacterium]|nr:histidine phosphatase family protein [Lachnospiraceae bacterium]